MFLRERLRPYVMKQMKLAHEKGIPPMHPLFFDFQHDTSTYDCEDQFLFGPDPMIAPITEFKTRDRNIYLPYNSEWTDDWTGTKYIDGQVIKARAPIEYISVFIRGDNFEMLKLFKDLYKE